MCGVVPGVRCSSSNRIVRIPPGPGDVDCAGGTGNGPRYVQGPVYVTGNDPYGLDTDHDGVGCES